MLEQATLLKPEGVHTFAGILVKIFDVLLWYFPSVFMSKLTNLISVFIIVIVDENNTAAFILHQP